MQSSTELVATAVAVIAPAILLLKIPDGRRTAGFLAVPIWNG